jgi:hypothetical protein
MMTKVIQLGRLLKLAVVLLTATACAYVPPARFPVTSDQVVAAMRNSQLPIEGLHVTMPVVITASLDHPELQIESMTLLSPHSAQLKVACREHGVCLAFYVSATWPAQSASVTLPPGLGHTDVQAGEAKLERVAVRHEPALRAGSRATLVIEGDHLHIRLEVVSLQNGAAGDKVRVSTPDHTRIFTAEILSPTLLKGSL